MLHFCYNFQIDIQCIFIANDCIEHMEPVLIINNVCAPFAIAFHKTSQCMFFECLCWTIECIVLVLCVHLFLYELQKIHSTCEILFGFVCWCRFALMLCTFQQKLCSLALKMIQLFVITTIKKCYRTMSISMIKGENIDDNMWKYVKKVSIKFLLLLWKRMLLCGCRLLIWSYLQRSELIQYTSILTFIELWWL